MSLNRPTIAELRACVHKDRHDEIGNWLARRVARPTAVYGCWLAIRLGLGAHQVTLLALASNLLAAVAIGVGTRHSFVFGVMLAHLAFWLDRVDGQVARWWKTASLDGVYLDYLMHHAANLVLGFGLGYGLAERSGNSRWAVLGMAVAAGWMFLSLQNDCRYKAFIQRLKSASGRFTVDCGAGGRPGPPSPWPRRGLGMISWPAFKMCEPHVVLGVLALLALLAAAAPTYWLAGWRLAVIGWAILGPLLAIARIARCVARNQVEAEFNRWYRPAQTASRRVVAPASIRDAAPWT